MPPQMIISLPVQTATCKYRAVGAFVVLVAVQLFMPGIVSAACVQVIVTYPSPPQTIISVPVQIAVCPDRACGTLVVLVLVQLSVAGSYLFPVFKALP